jgi:hypothetical protein
MSRHYVKKLFYGISQDDVELVKHCLSKNSDIHLFIKNDYRYGYSVADFIFKKGAVNVLQFFLEKHPDDWYKGRIVQSAKKAHIPLLTFMKEYDPDELKHIDEKLLRFTLAHDFPYIGKTLYEFMSINRHLIGISPDAFKDLEKRYQKERIKSILENRKIRI